MRNSPTSFIFNNIRELEEKIKKLKTHSENISGTLKFSSSDNHYRNEKIFKKDDFLEEIVNLTPDIIYIYDIVEKKNIYTNTRFSCLLGYREDEMNENNPVFFSDIIHPEDYHKYLNEVYPKYFVLIGKDRIDHHFRLKNKQGSWKWFYTRETVYRRDPDGNPIMIFGIANDISEKQEAVKALVESEERYSLVVEATNTGIWDWHINSNKVYFSTKWKTMLGYKPNEIANKLKVLENLIHPDDYERMKYELETFLANPKPIFEAEFRMKHKDGSYRWIHNRAAVIINKSEHVIRMTGSHVDITQQKIIRLQIDKLNQAIHQSPVPVVITDVKGRIEFVNQRYCQLTGYQYAEVMGQKTNIIKSDIHNNGFYQNLWQTILSGKTWHGEMCNRKKSGELYWELASVSPIFDEKGVIRSFVKVCEDISEKKKIEAELKIAKEKAEIANIHKDNFLANVSHEIRTPMNGIIGFAELLKDPKLEQKIREKYIKIIRKNSETLLSLIDDIIDISKMEVGELQIQPGAFDLIDLMHEIYILFDELKRLKEKHEIKLKLKIPSSYPHLIIESDKVRLKQVILNMLTNSLKFTKKGKIEFGFKMIRSHLEFFISDTGIGIPEEKQKIIFERFQQSDDTIGKRFGGTGLGLAISKGLVHLLGGEIDLKSKPGRGSLFRFTIPFTRLKIESELLETGSTKSSSKLRGKTILIAEDEDDILEYLKTILTNEGANILYGKNGYETIEQFATHDNIDLILMDINMPVLNGFETTEKIHAIDRTIPIIAQTAYAMQDEKEKCLTSGCVDYVTKPIKPAELINKIEKYL